MNKKILFIDNDQVLFKEELMIAYSTAIYLSAYIAVGAIEKFNLRDLNKGLISRQNNLGL